MNAWLAYLHDRIVYIENTTDWFIICVSYGLQLINATIIFLRHDFHIESSPQAIDTWGCIFVSMNCVSNGSGNGLLHFWQKNHYLNQWSPFVTFETNWNELWVKWDLIYFKKIVWQVSSLLPFQDKAITWNKDDDLQICSLIVSYWRHMAAQIWSTMAQVMACCLTAPNHCLSQYWLFINEVQWPSSEIDFRGSAQKKEHSKTYSAYHCFMT